MGRVAKGVKCSVQGCEERAVRSVSAETTAHSGLKVAEGRRAYLCEQHYKQLKKQSKRDKMLEKWRRMT